VTTPRPAINPFNGSALPVGPPNYRRRTWDFWEPTLPSWLASSQDGTASHHNLSTNSALGQGIYSAAAALNSKAYLGSAIPVKIGSGGHSVALSLGGLSWGSSPTTNGLQSDTVASVGIAMSDLADTSGFTIYQKSNGEGEAYASLIVHGDATYPLGTVDTVAGQEFGLILRSQRPQNIGVLFDRLLKQMTVFTMPTPGAPIDRLLVREMPNLNTTNPIQPRAFVQKTIDGAGVAQMRVQRIDLEVWT
jgi:hypothetical protein